MGSARDHEGNAYFRDRTQQEDALMSDGESVANGASSEQRSWEEWAEKTSWEQIKLLRENNRRKALRALRKQNLLRMCRFTLPVAAAALLFFLCAIPTGRAFANATIQNITRLVGHFFYLQSADGDEPPTSGEVTAAPSAIPDGFDKIKEASKQVQAPLLYIGKEGLGVTDVSVGVDDIATTVQIEYRTSENDSIVTCQKVSKAQTGWGATMDADGNAPQTRVLFNGETLYCMNTHEGHVFGSARWGDNVFFISSPTLKWEKLLESVDALACVQ